MTLDDTPRPFAKPTPGGYRPLPSSPPPTAAPTATVPLPPPIPPLDRITQPFLRLLGQLQHNSTQPDPVGLFRQLTAALTQLPVEGRALGLDDAVATQAQAALAFTLDDVIGHSPWGGVLQGASLAATVCGLSADGAGFFPALDALLADPAADTALLRLYLYCLDLGLVGGYREGKAGRATWELARQRLLTALRQREPAPPAALSRQWQGFRAPLNRRMEWPPLGTWVLVLVAVVLAVQAGASHYRHAVLTAHMQPWLAAMTLPADPPPATVAVAERWRDQLSGEPCWNPLPRRGLVVTSCDGLFLPPHAALTAKGQALLALIGQLGRSDRQQRLAVAVVTEPLDPLGDFVRSMDLAARLSGLLDHPGQVTVAYPTDLPRNAGALRVGLLPPLEIAP